MDNSRLQLDLDTERQDIIMLDLLIGDNGWAPQMLKGFYITMMVAFLAYFFSLVFGVIWSIMASSKYFAIRAIWNVYSSIIMGVPPLLVIFFVFYNLPMLLKSLFGLDVEVSPFAASVAALAIVFSAYLGEAFRGAFKDVHAGQFEAARALGLNTVPMFTKVILPQVLRLATPALSNIWLVVLKDTAYVSLVGLSDIVRVSRVAAGTTNEPFLFFLTAGAVFILLAIVSAYIMRLIERRLDRPYNLRATPAA